MDLHIDQVKPEQIPEIIERRITEVRPDGTAIQPLPDGTVHLTSFPEDDSFDRRFPQ